MDLSKNILAAFNGVKKDATQSLHQAQYTGDYGMSSDFLNADYNAAKKKTNILFGNKFHITMY